MGSFTVGITSGSIVSATASTDVVSGIASWLQGDELTELSNGKGSVNDGNNSNTGADVGGASD